MSWCSKCVNNFIETDACNHCIGSVETVPTQFVSKDAELPVLEFEDEINKPNHYHKNEIDVNGYLEKHFPKEANVTVAEGFYIGNIFKYVSRHKEKGGLRDLKKAQFNLNKLIEWRKNNG